MNALASPALWLDLVVAALLAVTVGYAWQLNRKLSLWRADKGQLLDLVRDFSVAAGRAERGVAQLKADGDQIARALEALVAKGSGLRDDLGFLVERAEPLADRLVDGVRRRPAAAKPPAEPPTGPPTPAERDLLRSLGGLR